jgi:hypothetical protein
LINSFGIFGRKKAPILPASISRAPIGASDGARAFEIFVTFLQSSLGVFIKEL